MNFLINNNSFFVMWLKSLDKTILVLLILWITLGLVFNVNSTLNFASIKLYNDPNILIYKYYFFIFIGILIIFFSSMFNENFYK